MLKCHNYDIVFQEIPNETTLAINIANCPNRCVGCHSPHLQQDIGEDLTESVLSSLLKKYGNSVTCVCFMGGDNAPEEVLNLAKFVRCEAKKFSPLPLKTAWYSGCSTIFEGAQKNFDYIKIGAYTERLGGLNSPATNQKLYRIENGKMTEIHLSCHL
ncbi:MAG: anaerobic ribonucleoside-triphosphate reductase activating protein [Prevotellaceae bacterium]|jgi:anaerobic ribonucleoside-triphosphate reductase activating protein|nr:anaerobic ribonucleoside-triphosphate reductase activating protein [Prevotellaceae bacterium]